MEFITLIATIGDMVNRVMRWVSDTRLINLGKDQQKKEDYEEIDRRLELTKSVSHLDDPTIDDELRRRYKNIK